MQARADSLNRYEETSVVTVRNYKMLSAFAIHEKMNLKCNGA